MKPLDYVNQRREQILPRITKLRSEIDVLLAEQRELDAAESVYRKATGATADETLKAAEPKRRGRRPGSVNKLKDPNKPNISDTILAVVGQMPNGGTKEDVTAALQAVGVEARQNHIGIALARHVRAGRLAESDGLWSVPAGVEAHQGDAALLDQAAE